MHNWSYLLVVCNVFEIKDQEAICGFMYSSKLGNLPLIFQMSYAHLPYHRNQIPQLSRAMEMVRNTCNIMPSQFYDFNASRPPFSLSGIAFRS